MKTFTPTLSPSVSFHPPHNIFIHFFVSPSSFFMQIYANGIILVFPLKVISKSEHRARLYSSSLLFLFYSCIVFHAWFTRVYFISPHFQSFGVGFNLSLLQTMHISSSVLGIKESVRKIIEADCQAKGIFIILIVSPSCSPWVLQWFTVPPSMCEHTCFPTTSPAKDVST